MRRLALATVGLLVAAASSAVAADLPARTYTKAPAALSAVYDWSGFYIGANGGGGWSHTCWTTSIVPTAREGCHDATGAVVGGQAGYRWQSDSWVLGVEAQGDWANLRGSNASLLAPATTNRSTVNALGLFTGQVGYAWNSVLWYVKGGAALTNDKYQGLATATGAAIDQASDTRWGGTVGTGVEFGLAPNLSAAVEYNHMFMGNSSVSFNSVAPPVGVFSRTDSVGQNVDVVSARVNYRWGGPVVGKW